MLLIADSGSTKTDWRLVNEEGKTVRAVRNQGLNPYFLGEKEISSIIENDVLPITSNVEKVLFYGAGCTIPEKAAQVKNAIEAVIPSRFPAEVSGDIVGAARSLLQDQSGIACILGTGANSCIYDGHEAVYNVPSLGYILADWGSGTVMCKDLISLLLQGKLDKKITSDFEQNYGLHQREILENIYNKPMANRFLASFTPFLLKHSNDPVCREVILDNFRKFFTYYVLRYNHHSDIKVSIVGSIAYHFKEFLVEVGAEMGISIDKIVQHPMDGLVKYHCMTSGIKNLKSEI